MAIRDPAHLATLMALAGLSTRQLAAEAGWKSHTYLLRVLDGEVRTVRPVAAIGIAGALGATVEELFVPEMTSNSGQSDRSARKACA